MIVIEQISELRKHLDALRAQGKSVGLVPTMGYLHAGHRSLMQAARAAHDVVVVSIFVNPLQFGSGEDIDRYPRDPMGDELAASQEGVDIMFAPVVTRFVTYSVPVPRFAGAYMEAVLDLPWMREWIEAAQEEPWVIERYETPA